MTPEEIQKVADIMLAGLKTQSEYWYIETNKDDPYKPSYRAMAFLVGPGEWNSCTKALGWGEDQVISKEDAIKVLCAAHPYFAEHLEKGRDVYEGNYDFIYEAWY